MENNINGTAVASDWNMDVTNTNPSDTGFPGAEAPGVTITVDPGPYSVDESGGPGGYVKSLSSGCAGVLALNGEATCTITNTFPEIPSGTQSLRIRKIILSDNDGTATLDDFDVSLNGIEVMWADPVSTTNGTVTVSNQPGNYVLSEADVVAYTEGNWSCGDSSGVVAVSNGGLFSGAAVTVGDGQHVLCVITNDDTDSSQSLKVEKNIITNNGGNASLDDFNVSVDGIEVVWANPASTTGGTETVSDQPGTYLLSEADIEGWDEGNWSCGDSGGNLPVTNGGLFSGSMVTIAPTQHVTCTITQ